MKSEFMFTSESVTEGHPDKLCDKISDAIVGRHLRQDPAASIVAECAISTGIIFVAARIASRASVDIAGTAREVVRRAGYERGGFDVRNCTVMTSITELPDDERLSVNIDELDDDQIERIAVGEQATVFGYACDHHPSLMPLPIWLAHKLAARLSEVRRQGGLDYLAPDGKTQVGVEFREKRPDRIHSFSLVASQVHPDGPPLDRLRRDLHDAVVLPAFEDEPIGIDRATRQFIGTFTPVKTGGPAVHSGMTGRKSASDTYGEFSRCSASALSGKDPSRIDRVGSYAARYAAKNVVAAGLAHECEVQLSYSIGEVRPVSVQVETFGSAHVSDAQLTDLISAHFDFRLAGIIKGFRLRQLPSQDDLGFYERLAAYGHVGRSDLDLPWEHTDKAAALRDAAGRLSTA